MFILMLTSLVILLRNSSRLVVHAGAMLHKLVLRGLDEGLVNKVVHYSIFDAGLLKLA